MPQCENLAASRETPREHRLASALASFVLPFEINLVLLWPQCPEEQTLGFLVQAKLAPEHPLIGKKTALRPPGSGRAQEPSWRWCDSGSGSTTKR